MKNTKAREKILEVLKGKTTPVTAEEIYQECFSSSINLSTIYRTLARFHEENLVEKEINSEGKSAYLLKKDEHCHILECIKCHKRILLDFCPYHEVNKDIYSKTGFKVQEHNITIYGFCLSCQNKECEEK